MSLRQWQDSYDSREAPEYFDDSEPEPTLADKIVGWIQTAKPDQLYALADMIVDGDFNGDTQMTFDDFVKATE